jgi:hypothetical protein
MRSRLETLALATSLTALTIDDADLGEEIAPALLWMTKLHYLCLPKAQWLPEVIEELTALPHLRRLELPLEHLSPEVRERLLLHHPHLSTYRTWMPPRQFKSRRQFEGREFMD